MWCLVHKNFRWKHPTSATQQVCKRRSNQEDYLGLALFLLPFCILTTRESQAHQKKTTANDAWLFADCDWLIFHKRRRKKRVQNNNNAFFPKNIFVSGWLTRGCVAYNIYISGLDFLFGYLAVWKFLDMTS